MLEKLRTRAQELYDINKTDDVLSHKYQLIINILENENCFLEMSIETAYSLLLDLGIDKEKLEKIYISLTKKENFDI